MQPRHLHYPTPRFSCLRPVGMIRSSGFALPEVLVSIIIIALYVGLGYQSFVISTVFKVQAERDAQVANWIDADVTMLRSQAGSLALAGNPPALAVPNDSRCRATTGANGFAATLQTNAGAATSDRQIYARVFRMVRSFNIDNTRPQILQVTYVVTDTTTNQEVARLQTEIIPDAFTLCSAGT